MRKVAYGVILPVAAFIVIGGFYSFDPLSSFVELVGCIFFFVGLYIILDDMLRRHYESQLTGAAYANKEAYIRENNHVRYESDLEVRKNTKMFLDGIERIQATHSTILLQAGIENGRLKQTLEFRRKRRRDPATGKFIEGAVDPVLVAPPAVTEIACND